MRMELTNKNQRKSNITNKKAAVFSVAFLCFFHFTVMKEMLSSIVRSGFGWHLRSMLKKIRKNY